MEFIVTPYTMEDIKRVSSTGAQGILIGLTSFSMRAAAYFAIRDLPRMRELTAQQDMKLYVLVNTFFVESQLEELRTHLRMLHDIGVDGIYYGDESVLYEAKKLGMEHKLIYNPDTLVTNKEDVQYYLDEGISMVTISKDITLQEICEIAKGVQGECEVIIHGRQHMMHSKRQLLSNYIDFLGKKEDVKDKNTLYIMEETRDEHMPIVEDAFGTHIYTGFTLSSFDELLDLEATGIRHVRIDGIFKDIDYVCEVLGLYQDILNKKRNGRKTYEEFRAKYPMDHVTHGFYYTKTSKVK